MSDWDQLSGIAIEFEFRGACEKNNSITRPRGLRARTLAERGQRWPGKEGWLGAGVARRGPTGLWNQDLDPGGFLSPLRAPKGREKMKQFPTHPEKG